MSKEICTSPLPFPASANSEDHSGCQGALEVAGTGLVGLAFAPGRSVVLATTTAIHRLSWNSQGLPLLAPSSGPSFSTFIYTFIVNVEIIAIGSELLTRSARTLILFTSTGKLNELGIEVIFKTIVGDSRKHLVQAATIALSRADIVIFMGGLGPTEDDLTREAVAGDFKGGIAARS